MINLTNSAKDKIKKIIDEEGDPKFKLRIFVQGGGCSGFQYGFSLDDTKNDDDLLLNVSEVEILVDALSLQYLENAEIDYVEDLQYSSFSIKNPNAQTTCGCGSSFSV